MMYAITFPPASASTPRASRGREVLARALVGAFTMASRGAGTCGPVIGTRRLQRRALLGPQQRDNFVHLVAASKLFHLVAASKLVHLVAASKLVHVQRTRARVLERPPVGEKCGQRCVGAGLHGAIGIGTGPPSGAIARPI